jgi:hypothetical protein
MRMKLKKNNILKKDDLLFIWTVKYLKNNLISFSCIDNGDFEFINCKR